MLWGIQCLSLQRAASGAQVVEEFRQAMLPVSKRLTNISENGAPQVELFQLVPVTNMNRELKEGDRVVCHLPESSLGCAELEELCQRCDDAQVLAERARESLTSLLRGPQSDPGHGSSPRSGDYSSSSRSSPRGAHSGNLLIDTNRSTKSAQELIQVLQEENGVLHRRLEEYERLGSTLNGPMTSSRMCSPRTHPNTPLASSARTSPGRGALGGGAVTVSIPSPTPRGTNSASLTGLPLTQCCGAEESAPSAAQAESIPTGGALLQQSTSLFGRKARWF